MIESVFYSGFIRGCRNKVRPGSPSFPSSEFSPSQNFYHLTDDGIKIFEISTNYLEKGHILESVQQMVKNNETSCHHGIIFGNSERMRKILMQKNFGELKSENNDVPDNIPDEVTLAEAVYFENKREPVEGNPYHWNLLYDGRCVQHSDGSLNKPLIKAIIILLKVGNCFCYQDLDSVKAKYC